MQLTSAENTLHGTIIIEETAASQATLTNCMKAQRIHDLSTIQQSKNKQINSLKHFLNASRSNHNTAPFNQEARKTKPSFTQTETKPYVKGNSSNNNIHLLFPTIALLQRLTNLASKVIIKLEQKKTLKNTHQFWNETPGQPKNLQPSNAYKKYAKT